LGLAKASVNCRTDSARVRVDILDHQGTSFGNPRSRVETNPQERAIGRRSQTFVKQKLDFLLREYLGLAVPFYLHLCVYSTRYQKVGRSYCIANRSGGFLINAAALLRSGIPGRWREFGVLPGFWG